MKGSAGWRLVVALGCLGWVVLYAGRAVLSPLLGTIGAEWGIAESQLGLLASAFFLGYATMQIPTGLLADRLGRKGLLVGGLLAFGAATALRGLAPGYPWLLAAGALAGLAQGTYYATMFAVSSAVVPPARRALGSAIVYSGMAVGTSAGYLVGSYLGVGLGWGWRMSFMALAVPAVAVGALFAWQLKEPPRAGARAPAARGAARPVRAAGVLGPRLMRAYFLNFTSLYSFFMLLSWLPYYLSQEQGFSASAAGLVASLVPWASIPAGLAVGLISDRRADRIGPLRLLLPAGALAVLGIGLAGSPLALYAALLLYGLVGKSATDPLLVAEVAELAPAGRSATALGILNFAGMVASVLAPYLTGLATHGAGTMRPAFYLAAAILVAGWAAALAAGRRKLPLRGTEPPRPRPDTGRHPG